MPQRVRSYCLKVTGIQGWFPFQLLAQFGITHAYREKRNKEHRNKSDKCREWNRGTWCHWLCVPWRVLCMAAWIRLEGDPWDVEVKGTKDEGRTCVTGRGHTRQKWNTPHTIMLVSLVLLASSNCSVQIPIVQKACFVQAAAQSSKLYSAIQLLTSRKSSGLCEALRNCILAMVSIRALQKAHGSPVAFCKARKTFVSFDLVFLRALDSGLII